MNMKKLLSTMSALVIFISMFLIHSQSVSAEPSNDSGYSDGTFKPDTLITEEDFLTMVVRALNLPIRTQPSDASLFLPYYDAARNDGIYYDDYRSDWSNPIIRGDAAQTLVRATQAAEKIECLPGNDLSRKF